MQQPSPRTEYLLPSLEGIPFVCPRCRRTVQFRSGAFSCRSCEKHYPVHAGIPDFRVFEDPFLSFQEDHERTDKVLQALDHHDLKSLLEFYWSMSDVTPTELRGRFIRSVMLGKNKARRTLALLRDGPFKQPAQVRRVLEIGSGTGNFLATACGQYDQVVGIDIAMRWLHVSRRRFADERIQTPALVCCCAQHLPFPDGYFDLVVASAVLEFTRNRDQLLLECSRVLTENGGVVITTTNRFSIAREPHVYLWGVGFLPRRWQVPYVRWRRNASYENIRPLSLGRLRKLARGCFPYQQIVVQDIDDDSLRHFGAFTKLQVYAYRALSRLPLLGWILRWLGPGWDAEFRKNPPKTAGN